MEIESRLEAMKPPQKNNDGMPAGADGPVMSPGRFCLMSIYRHKSQTPTSLDLRPGEVTIIVRGPMVLKNTHQRSFRGA